MKLKNKKTGEIGQIGYVATQGGQIIVEDISGEEYPYSIISSYDSLAELNEDWEDVEDINVTNIPLIKDEKIRKAVRAWADVLEIDEAEFYGAETWIGFRSRDSRTGWLSKFEVDCFGSDNTLVPFRRYTITELCGGEE